MARALSPERPLSVVVLGNSVAVLSIPARTGSGDGPYAEVLRDRLAGAGVPVRVANEGRWFDFAVKGFRRYEQSVRAHLPDVLILQYGLNEMQPWLMPVPVLRHLVTEHQVATRTGRWYRAKVAAPAWKGVRSYRRWAAPHVGQRTWQTTPARFGEVMRQIIRAARYDSRPLVLVLDVNPPGPVIRHFLPGIEERHVVIQRTLATTVASFADPEVRLVGVAQACAAAGPETSYDGMHLSPEGHRVVGELLAQEILGWLGRPEAPLSL